MPNEQAEFAAAIIARDERPDWLVTGLSEFSHVLARIIAEEAAERRPAPREIVKRLRALASAAQLVQNEVISTEIANHIYKDAFDCIGQSIDHERAMHACLADLVARAEAAAEEVPVAKGRPKQREIPAKRFCALGIRFAWKMAQGEWPSLRGEKVARACHAVWEHAGGKGGWGADSLRVWREHLAQAQSMQDAPEVQRSMRGFFRKSLPWQPNPARQKRWYDDDAGN